MCDKLLPWFCKYSYLDNLKNENVTPICFVEAKVMCVVMTAFKIWYGWHSFHLISPCLFLEKFCCVLNFSQLMRAHCLAVLGVCKPLTTTVCFCTIVWVRKEAPEEVLISNFPTLYIEMDENFLVCVECKYIQCKSLAFACLKWSIKSHRSNDWSTQWWSVCVWEKFVFFTVLEFNWVLVHIWRLYRSIIFSVLILRQQDLGEVASLEMPIWGCSQFLLWLFFFFFYIISALGYMWYTHIWVSGAIVVLLFLSVVILSRQSDQADIICLCIALQLHCNAPWYAFLPILIHSKSWDL